jgi:hypothetical protein
VPQLRRCAEALSLAGRSDGTEPEIPVFNGVQAACGMMNCAAGSAAWLTFDRPEVPSAERCVRPSGHLVQVRHRRREEVPISSRSASLPSDCYGRPKHVSYPLR